MSSLTDHIVELIQEELVFNSSLHTICVHLNISGISKAVMVNLTLHKDDNEQAIRWTNQNVTVEILPMTLEERPNSSKCLSA